MITGSDVVFTIGSGMLKLTDAKDKTGSSGAGIYADGELSELEKNTVPAGFTAVSLTNGDE